TAPLTFHIMRPQYVVMLLVTVATLITGVETFSVGTDSKAAKLSDPTPLTSLSDMGLKTSLRAEKATEELNDEDEERGKVSAFLTKKIDPKIAAKADDLKKSPNIGPKVLAKADSKVLAGIESKGRLKNTVPAVPKELTAVNSKMSKEGKEVMKKLDGFVKEQNSLEKVFASQVKGKWDNGLFAADGLPMYVRFSELTAKQRGQDTYGVNLLVTHFGQEKLMLAVNKGLTSGDSLAAATVMRVRAGLLNKWWKEKKDVREVAHFLKGGNVVVPTVNKGVAKTS
ncbi:hypothetical protein GN958_ATG12019, partial [Phytophthora infestans]